MTEEERLALEAEQRAQQEMMSDLFPGGEVSEGETNEEENSFDSNFQENLEEAPEVPEVPEVVVAPEVVVEQVTEPTAEESLRAQLIELTARLEGVQQIYPVPAAEAPVEGQTQTATVQPQPQTQQVTATQAYLTEDELDQVIDNPALIVTAIQRAQQDVVQQIAANLPQVISQIVNQQVMVQQAVSEFYDANKDLRQYSGFVKFVMGEMETKHKDKPFNEIFQLTADESRKRLGLKNPDVVNPERKPSQQQRPAFAGSRRTGTSRPAGKEVFFDPAVADMLS